MSETTAFGVPTLRSMVQYSQVLAWCKVGSPVLPHTAAKIGKYFARNASVTEPLMLLTPQGRYSLLTHRESEVRVADSLPIASRSC